MLDAPRLKDDFYCSVLAYCYTRRTLAVALAHRVYLWTEQEGVQYPPLTPVRSANYVGALAFSSEAGQKAILAVARNSGHVTLWSLFEQKARFEIPHPWAACALAFRPTCTQRQCPDQTGTVPCEDLLVGDDSGCIYYYGVHWPDFAAGSLCLLTKIDAHAQNICGLAWSPDGNTFASGGNDNAALLFEAEAVLLITSSCSAEHPTQSTATPRDNGLATATEISLTPPQSPQQIHKGGPSSLQPIRASITLSAQDDSLTPPSSAHRSELRGRPMLRRPRDDQWNMEISPTRQSRMQDNIYNRLADPSIDGRINLHTHRFYHSAAVKAIAYAPWQSTLLATGGGSNDRQIHFHHTASGTTLAVINVFAQVTSLAWSLTRREVVATFGYAQPEHNIRIAVFAWPSCECVVSIPWERKPNGEIGRALWAIPYPGGPNDAASEKELQARSTAPDTNGPGPASDAETGLAAWVAMQARNLRSNAVTSNPDSDQIAVPVSTSALSQHVASTEDDMLYRRRRLSSTRGEGEAWASRTTDEGSLIVACCDQTVKFFEVWAGKSKGKSKGIGAKAGVLGGSKVLEGWCTTIDIDEVDGGNVIR